MRNETRQPPAGGRRRWRRLLSTSMLALAIGPLLGCATIAEFRKLEYEVNKLKAEQGAGPEGARLADVASEMQVLREELGRLEGRLEVSEHQARAALEEARAARREAASSALAPGSAIGPGGPANAAAAGVPDAAPAGSSVELRAYREAYDAWRSDANELCIDRFREFLQAYPSSEYADDASFWMADCYFKQGDFQTAILRFDDVASRYPTSDKAADALYRQGEALLRLGPRYSKAAEKAFERVINEYPESVRASEAQRQLSLLASG